MSAMTEKETEKFEDCLAELSDAQKTAESVTQDLDTASCCENITDLRLNLESAKAHAQELIKELNELLKGLK